MGYIRWFLSFLKKYRVRMIVGLILVFITSLLVLINPQISGMIVDEVIEGQHYEKLGILLLIMIGVTLVRSLLRFTFLMCFESSSQGLVYDMREEAYRRKILTSSTKTAQETLCPDRQEIWMQCVTWFLMLFILALRISLYF